MRILVFILGIALSVLILKYTEPIVRTVGKSVFAEKYLGMGGTYNMWKLIALLIAIASILYAFGVFDFNMWPDSNTEIGLSFIKYLV